MIFHPIQSFSAFMIEIDDESRISEKDSVTLLRYVIFIFINLKGITCLSVYFISNKHRKPLGSSPNHTRFMTGKS